MKVSILLIILGFSQVLGRNWEVKCALDSLDIVDCSSSEDCKICSDCNTVQNNAFCANGVCKCIYTVLYPSDDENNLDYINAKPEEIQSEEAFDREMVSNKLENPEKALQELAHVQPKKECNILEFMDTICSSDEDCKQCSNTPQWIL